MNASTRHFACNTYSYTVTHDAVHCLTHLADLGFSEVELMMYPGHLWPPDADAAARAGEMLNLVASYAADPLDPQWLLGRGTLFGEGAL